MKVKKYTLHLINDEEREILEERYLPAEATFAYQYENACPERILAVEDAYYGAMLIPRSSILYLTGNTN